MKIAQVAPLIESVPPRLYGGTERVVSYLTEELVALGHEVTLFASGDSITAANLVPCCTQALRLDTAVSDVVPYYMLMLDKVRSHALEFDSASLPYRPSPFPDFQAPADPEPDDTARPPGSPRLSAVLCRLQRHAAGINLGRTTGATTAR